MPNTNLELKVLQKRELNKFLSLKKANAGKEVTDLQRIIRDLTAEMEQEDVAWVEKIVGVKANE